ncbi:MAG: type I glutamate--ammonia ligase [Deltaproteobacteria bacterium]|nr:type I glutamate--ammonia ligase [Deltaproteobacteria bacterium]
MSVSTPREVVAFAKENRAKMVDFKFTDYPGMWHHFSVPIGELDEQSFADGFGFDGSSIRGWRDIHESDMLVIADPATAAMDPFTAEPTLSLICDISDPVTGKRYDRDPRYIAQKTEAYIKSAGLADSIFIGPEPEFFIFDDIRFNQTYNEGFYYIDSAEGRWNSGRKEDGGNLGYKPRYKEGYFPVPPSDTYQDLRTEMALLMQQAGIHVECQHHEVSTAGQCEIDMRFTTLTRMADQFMWFKYIIKNVARRHGKTVTFMPKPIFGDNGSGMHTHMSFWKENANLFAGSEYGGLSKNGLYAIGGILRHAKALCAITNCTTNSYRRLVPGFEAPINLVYSVRNRSAAVRIPMYSSNPKAKRIEFRTPDPACNGYLAFAAIAMAAIDGIKNKIDPGQPIDKDVYTLSGDDKAALPQAPGSLDESLMALKADHEFLLMGDVFTRDVIETWIEYKWMKEVNPVRLRPVPHEFELYYDI